MKLIWLGEAYCIIAKVPLTISVQPPRLVGSCPGAIQLPATVVGQRLEPKAVANEPGAFGWLGSNEAPFVTVTCPDSKEATRT